MITEYRIVCTLDVEHRDGKRFHYDLASAVWGGTHHRLETRKKSVAEEWLKQAQREVPFFEAKNHKRWEDPNDRNVIKYTQTNIRIATRKVSEWK